MRSFQIKTILGLLFVVVITTQLIAQDESIEIIDFNRLSEQFLQHAKDGKDTNEFQEKLANTNLNILQKSLRTNEQKLAFWVNVYNAYIQVTLKENPELYSDRRSFFGDDRIKIAGSPVSFAKIEHGIIRKSQWSLGLGYFRTWFPNKFERKLRVDKRDYRVHFALNCGAKDCPPVAIYKADRLNEQFDKSTSMYLKRTSGFNADKREVAVTSLFSWFRGDFGSKKGVKKILRKHDIIPTTKDIDIVYKNYDWTLELDNFIDL